MINLTATLILQLHDMVRWLGERWHKTRRWLWQHKLLVGVTIGATAGTTYLVVKHLYPLTKDLFEALRLLRQLRDEDDSNLINDSKDSLENPWILGFGNAMDVSLLTLQGCSCEIRSKLSSRFDIKKLRKKLKIKGEKSQEDLRLWKEFQLSGFARTFSAFYCVAIVNFVIKIQSCIVHRYCVSCF